MPQTARQVIESSLRIIGVLGRGRGIDDEDANEGFVTLNDMLAVWANEGLTVPNLTKFTGLSYTAGVSEYTVGTGLDISVLEPIAIDHMVTISGTDRFPMDKLPGIDSYIRHTASGTQDRPTEYFYERGKLYVASIPDSSYGFEIWSRNPFGPITNLATDISFSDEYLPALKFNLAIDLAAENGKEPKSTVITRAADYKQGIEARRFINEPLKSEVPMGHYRDGTREI